MEVAAPCTCPHWQEATDRSKLGSTSYLQEDIVLRPRTIVTRWVHQTAWCPGCRRKVFATLEGELPFAPIGPTAKAAALYLRHETKLPYRKLQKLMSDLFGLDFVPASSLGFEKRACSPAQPVYDDLIRKMRHCDLVHADETYWREDGQNVFIWDAGNEEVAVYRIVPRFDFAVSSRGCSASPVISRSPPGNERARNSPKGCSGAANGFESKGSGSALIAWLRPMWSPACNENFRAAQPPRVSPVSNG